MFVNKARCQKWHIMYKNGRFNYRNIMGGSMDFMSKDNIKLQLCSEFLENDSKNSVDSDVKVDSELRTLKSFKNWLLEKLAEEYYGKVKSDGTLIEKI